jgi:hypothetical protein
MSAENSKAFHNNSYLNRNNSISEDGGGLIPNRVS